MNHERTPDLLDPGPGVLHLDPICLFGLLHLLLARLSYQLLESLMDSIFPRTLLATQSTPSASVLTGNTNQTKQP